MAAKGASMLFVLLLVLHKQPVEAIETAIFQAVDAFSIAKVVCKPSSKGLATEKTLQKPE